MMRRAGFIGLLLGLLVLAGCAADEWQTVRTDEDERYLVALPQGAEEADLSTTSLATGGEEVELVLADYRHVNSHYLVAHASLDDEAESAEEIDEILDDAQRWLVEASGQRPRELDISTISWNGYPGRAYRFRVGAEGPATEGRARILLAEEELYFLIASGPEDAVETNAARFLTSFVTGED